MAFVQVKNTLQTWKLAAFIVAFFSPFFSHSVDFTDLDNRPATPEVYYPLTCNAAWNGENSTETSKQTDNNSSTMTSICSSLTKSVLIAGLISNGRINVSFSHIKLNKVYVTHSGVDDEKRGIAPSTTSSGIAGVFGAPEYVDTCKDPAFIVPNTADDQTLCYRPEDVELLLASERDIKNKNKECQSLVLDSGNNTSPQMCHTSASGSSSCNVEKVTTDGGGTYYRGVSASDGGCVVSDKPAYDDSGSGDAKDDCLFSEGKNYCAADRNKHCSVISGSEICDDGCIDDGTNLFCDISKHPDVGEGDSDFFDDNGTCSVISASSSKGFCEDSGGTWDETQDYKETSCPVGAGSCSIPVAGLCNSCFDAGGTWTPDPNAPLNTQEKAAIETTALIKDTNDKLTQIEHGQRKSNESLNSTVKSGSNKVVAAIEALGEKLDKPNEEEEKESYTTTTSDIDKSKINALFGDVSKAALQADIEKIKSDTTTFINSVRAEATSLFKIEVPASTGYETRSLNLTQVDLDLSLGRFDYFFKLLSGPIMFLCSVIAGFILLRKD